ncbi:uncharacterized protein LOC132747393 [Ruditapes philippinarum]|uniref:uncharacterized protein LOC132747393 n=1 Tax=Ruditapes philippinarum TaxID=129788 RepID=UPI00295ABFC9|nr:uncharacterized protein LOC132747393 [Ruditapes philippinarum]
MFDHNFIEKKEREVKLAGKKYDDFKEFLLCLHPAVQKEISRSNVLSLALIAEEYQVAIFITRCKNVMWDWLRMSVKGTNSEYTTANDLRKYAANCLLILHKALECRYAEITDEAISSVCKFGYGVFSGRLRLNMNLSVRLMGLSRTARTCYITAADEDVEKSECYDLFEDLPEDIKYKLLTERLILCESNNMIGVN